MLNYDRDFINTINRKNNKMKCYDSLYFSSTEDFNHLFSEFDFDNKDIFSIIGSGDQAFYFYNRGANQVDLYDINIVTIYYYYLRLWCIKYLNCFYPVIDTDFFNELLSKVEPDDLGEENAYNYWKKMMENISYNYELNSLFFLGSFYRIERYIKDISKFRDIISSKDVNYTPMDITNPVNIDKKFDMIYVSNLSEYIRDIHSFIVYSDNLDKLLKDDGIVVGCNILDPCPSNNETKVLSKKFDYHNINTSSEERSLSPGFYYTKKRD